MRLKSIALLVVVTLLVMGSVAGIAATGAEDRSFREGLRFIFRCFDPALPECASPPPVFYFRLEPVYDFPQFTMSAYYDPTAEVKDIKLGFTIPGTVFKLGDKIVVEMWLTNMGNREIRLYFGDTFLVVFEDERGLKWIPARIRLAFLSIAQLEPNESIHRKERLILQAGSPIGGEVPPYTLEPGTYTLHVFADISFSDPAKRAGGVRIWAPPVQIEIRESTDKEG